MKLALKQLHPLPSRGERLQELDGVTYINDASASNPLALDCSLRALKPPKPNEPHVWLIAGGDIGSLDYHQLGPLISHRVKGFSDWTGRKASSGCANYLRLVRSQ